MAKERAKLVCRWALWLILLWLVVRGAVSVVSPKEPAPLPAQTVVQAPSVDNSEATAHALLFAREYLTWQRSKAEEYSARLRLWLPQSSDPAAAVDLTSAARDQRVTGVWVYRIERSGDSRQVVQVAAEVVSTDSLTQDRPALVLLGVPIQLTAGGPVVSDLPFFLPPPAVQPGPMPTYSGDALADVDEEIRALVLAFFKAYADGADTRFFMVPGAVLTGFPPGTIALSGTPSVRLYKQKDGIHAVADLLWRDPRSQTQFRQRYILELVKQDRWLVKQILLERGTGQ